MTGPHQATAAAAGSCRVRYSSRGPTFWGKCRTLRVSSREPARIAVAAMARSAPSMARLLGIHRRPRAPASSATPSVNRMPDQGCDQRPGRFLFSRPQTPENLQPCDLAGVQRRGPALPLEKLSGALVTSQVVDQHRGVDRGAHGRSRTRVPERTWSTHVAPSTSRSLHDLNASRMARKVILDGALRAVDPLDCIARMSAEIERPVRAATPSRARRSSPAP